MVRLSHSRPGENSKQRWEVYPWSTRGYVRGHARGGGFPAAPARARLPKLHGVLSRILSQNLDCCRLLLRPRFTFSADRPIHVVLLQLPYSKSSAT